MDDSPIVSNDEQQQQPHSQNEETTQQRQEMCSGAQKSESPQSGHIGFYMKEAIGMCTLVFPHIDRATMRIQFPPEASAAESRSIFALVTSADNSFGEVHFRGCGVALLHSLPPAQRSHSLLRRTEDATSRGEAQDKDTALVADDPLQQRIIALKSLWNCLDEHMTRMREANAGESDGDDADISTGIEFSSDLSGEGVDVPVRQDGTAGEDDAVTVGAEDIERTARVAVAYAEALERVHEMPLTEDDEGVS